MQDKKRLAWLAVLFVASLVFFIFHRDSPSSEPLENKPLRTPTKMITLVEAQSVPASGTRSEREPTVTSIGSEDKPQVLDPNAEISDEQKTVLVVRVQDSQGFPVLDGLIDSIEDPSVTSGLRLDFEHKFVPIAGETTRIEIRSEPVRVIVSASAPGHRPGRTRHMIVPHSENRITVVLDRAIEGETIFGNITVDGVATCPEGLTIELTQFWYWDFTEEEKHLGPLALVDWQKSNYVISARRKTAKALWVFSHETVPFSMPISWPEGVKDLEFNLALTRGTQLTARIVDLKTGLPLVGLCVQVNLGSELEESRDSEGVVHMRWRYVGNNFMTDERGELVVSGIPLQGTVSLSTCSDWQRTKIRIQRGDKVVETVSMQRASMDLLRLYRNAERSERLFRTIPWSGKTTLQREVGGQLPERVASDPEVQVRYALFLGGQRLPSERVENHWPTGWSVPIFQGVNYEFWLERNGVTISKVEMVYVVDSEPVQVVFELL